MKVLDFLGISNKSQQRAARDALADHMLALAGVDDYGMSAESIYQRFNAAGADYHGQCAVAQGACGYGIDISAGFDFGKLAGPTSPVTALVSAGLGGARMPRSSIMIFRIPPALSSQNFVIRPIALAQMEGVSKRYNAYVKAKLGASTDMFSEYSSLLKGAAAVDASVVGTVEGNLVHTKLVAFGTDHFPTASTRALSARMDEMLGVEVKKTVLNILAFHEMEIAKVGKKAAFEAFLSGAIRLATWKQEELIKLGTNAKQSLMRGEGWGMVIAGFAQVPAAVTLGKVGYDAFKAYQDKKLEDQLTDLHQKLQAEVRARQSTASNDEMQGLLSAMQRTMHLKVALYDQRVYGDASDKKPGVIPKVDSKHLKRVDETALNLTSYEYGIKGDFKANAHVVLAMDATARADVGVAGRHVDFRFQVRGPKGLMMYQDTHANFFQMSASAAWESQFAYTGVAALDEAAKKSALGQKSTVGVTSAGPRRYGALTYNAATIYKVQGSDVAVAGVSGMSFGLTLRAARLSTYARIARGMKGGPPDKHTSDFEAWASRSLCCTPTVLRKFMAESFLGYDDVADDGTTVYPNDALLLEANYAYTRAQLPKLKMVNTPQEPQNLHDYLGFRGLAAFQSDVAAGTYALSSLRVRYRIESPLTTTSNFKLPLGLPKKFSPIVANFDFSKSTEVGQEAIVDLYTWFSPRIRAIAETEQDKYDLCVPPVVLFNQG